MIIDILLIPFVIIISIIAGNYIANREAKKQRRKKIDALLKKMTNQQDEIDFEIINKFKQI